MSAAIVRRPHSTARLVGLDLFRAVAVFGMLVAHVGPAAWTPGDGFGTVHAEWEIFHSRMPAMFAFAAGLSLNLGRRRGTDVVQPAVLSTVIRAALLAVCGVALTLLGTPVVVILGYFAVWFILILPFRRLGVRALIVVAGMWAVVGPLVSFAARRTVDLPGNPLWSSLVAGDYPALTWMPFVLAGLAVGRLNLSSTRVRVGLAVAGAVLVGVGYGLSAMVLTRVVTARIVETLTPTAEMTAVQEFARLFFKERGVTDTGTWLWLLVPAPHSGSWADVIGCLGVCALILAVLLPIGDAALWADGARTRTKKGVGVVLASIATLGAMVLSGYAAHIVLMAIITATTGHSFRGAQSVLMLAAFTAGLLLFSSLWMRRFPQGPLEWLLSRASSLIERTGRRVSAGSWRR
ncbi:DUF418 domain-containing protein [Microbacterium sp. 22303]|uniref:DUF418 domain-containing protein n=1 Tax=Microbacterium sp. 22303 TaxID=3453905 RepID=UPI003F85616F